MPCDFGKVERTAACSGSDLRATDRSKWTSRNHHFAYLSRKEPQEEQRHENRRRRGSRSFDRWNCRRRQGRANRHCCRWSCRHWSRSRNWERRGGNSGGDGYDVHYRGRIGVDEASSLELLADHFGQERPAYRPCVYDTFCCAPASCLTMRYTWRLSSVS